MTFDYTLHYYNGQINYQPDFKQLKVFVKTKQIS